MFTYARNFAMFGSLLLAPTMLCGQDAQGSTAAAENVSPHVKLVYRTIDVNGAGKVRVAHSYATIIAATGTQVKTVIRSQDVIPIPTNHDGTQYQYDTVGTKIDSWKATIHEDRLALHVAASVDEAIESALSSAAVRAPAPTMRSSSWESDVIVPLGHPTIIFSSDNVSDTGKTELELTATEIKQP